MALMWAAEWPPAKHLSDGAPSMSSNPVIDYHVMYAVILIVLAVAAAGRTWGPGEVVGGTPVRTRQPLADLTVGRDSAMRYPGCPRRWNSFHG